MCPIPGSKQETKTQRHIGRWWPSGHKISKQITIEYFGTLGTPQQQQEMLFFLVCFGDGGANMFDILLCFTALQLFLP